MFQISDNAGNLIRKMTNKNGFPDGGLRIGIKAGGCSGLSYVFAWEPTPKDGDHVFEGRRFISRLEERAPWMAPVSKMPRLQLPQG